MKNLGFYIFTFLILGLVVGCQSESQRLPILGNMEVINGDSILHTIPDMELTNQDSQVFKVTALGDKIVIADFFFTSCPSICPKVKKQMLRIYDRYKNDDRIVLISHTIDQRHDSVAVLKRYAHNLGVDTEKWKFVTADKDSIFHLADQYFVSVVEDPSAPMGFDHSGRIILVDPDRHVRGFCEGTEAESVTTFFKTIDELLKEEDARVKH